MKLCSYLLLLLTLFAFQTKAQQTTSNSITLNGSVVEQKTGDPVEQATIRLLSIPDSSLVRGTVSTANGAFSLKSIKPGNYILHITYVGFDPIYQPVRITGRRNPVSVGKMGLTETGIQLGEAVVTAKAAEVVVKNDTLEYNADSYKTTEGAVLEDLLKKMPGVEVSSDGTITVNGKQVKKIMVDGKEFFSDDPKVAAKNLPAKMVNKLQVLDKKSDMSQMTGFDDGEEETVINLTVKPGMKEGIFGNAFAGYGSRGRYEGNAMVNRFINNDQYTFMGGLNNTNNMGFTDVAGSMFGGMGGGGRRFSMGTNNGITTSGNAGSNFSKQFSPQLTLGGNGRYSHSSTDATSSIAKQNILTGDSTSYENTKSVSNTKNDNFGVNLRLEWKPDSMTQILFRPDISYYKSQSDELDFTNTLAGNLDTVNVSNSKYHSYGEGYSTTGQLEFSRKLNNTGRVFSASVTGGLSDSYNKGTNWSNTQYYRITDGSADNLIDQKFRYDNNGYNYRAFLSWVEPIGHNNFLQATYSYSKQYQKSLKNSYTTDDDGNYSVLDSTYSKSYRNNFTTQRASLSFMAQRQKYNFTMGVNFDPSHSTSETFVGDTVLYHISRNVFNVSPMAIFNYKFSQQKNLRIQYNGSTTQPSMTQLSPVADVSNPLNITKGNPDLDPTYTNRLSLRFQNFNREKMSALMLMLNGTYTLNDIVSYATYDNTTGGRVTTYKNVNGNYNADMRMMVNTPFFSKKFTFNSSTMASYAKSNGFVNAEKNTNKNLVLSERGGFDFRSDYVDLGINGNITYNKATNSLQTSSNLETYTYGVGGSTTLYLPYNFQVQSDITWSANSGYSSGYKLNETLWNASLSKSFLKDQGTLQFKIYDILKQRSNISRMVTASATTDTQYNTLNSYFMFRFIYRFSIFKGGASFRDAFRGGPGGGGPGGPGGGRPDGPGGPGGGPGGPM